MGLKPRPKGRSNILYYTRCCNTKDIPRDLNAAINLQRERASSLGLADECGLGGFPHEQLVQEDTVRLFLHSKCCLTPESAT